ncbi:plant UBX domain-containing protein 4-like [Argentina anserina]|uniref:plant UBX domain-containing protein 4-like n=1 Tax=Argentina anserina TaxID=57926 RepID=UPI002176842D|nr:plant UBX domain-containing protein 4-like [Potentilla anserina]
MASKDKKPSKSRTGGIHTLSDLDRRSADSDSDSDAPQEYYTGGEKSGMLVQDPSKGNDVDSIFDQVRELGVVEGPVDPSSASSSSRSFAGTGRLLSGETVHSAPPQQPETVVHSIVFWSDGFSVNDGPLRRVDDPENAPFLESIVKSECPSELEPEDRSTAVHVNVIRRQEKYPETVKRQVAFQGVGRTLGSSSASEPTASSTPLGTGPTPSVGLVVDESLPTTSVQLRLADGTRMIAQFNYHQTISDIRTFIETSRPGSPSNYQLQLMGFPPKVLNDPNQTIEQAGLANSVVIQKL